MVLVDIRGVPALAVAREVFVLAISKATALRNLWQMSLNAEQSLSSWYTSPLMAAAAVFAWLTARFGDRPRPERSP